MKQAKHNNAREIIVDLKGMHATLKAGIPASTLAKASAGDMRAQCRIADRLLQSKSHSIRGQGLFWLRHAARAGEPWAEYMLGVSYDYGDDVPKDRVRAAYWYAWAAAQNYDSAQLNLGIILAHKRKPQIKEAIRLYKLAAAQGNRNAKYNLGMYYAEGRGIRRNLRQAFGWYFRAAQQGDAYAQNYVGYCYHKGEGITRHFGESVRWYRKAARAGNMFAMYNLGLCYKFGDGVPKSLPLARHHFRAAAAAGHTGARRQLQSCAR